MYSLARNVYPKLIVTESWKQFNRGVTHSFPTVTAHFDLEPGPNERGPFPRTKEERERAAKKYNLIPEDYEPYDEGEGYGDYPKLKAIGGFNRDRYDDFDDIMDHRFYGEPFHADADLYYWERIDPLKHEKLDVALWVKFVTFFGIAFTIPTLHWIFKTYKLDINHPYKQRLRHPKDQKYYHFP